MKAKKISISFYKKVKCWYAEVPEHTESQNLMVQGADDLCEVMAMGKKRVSIEIVISESPLTITNSLVDLVKTEQSKYGAWYSIKGIHSPETPSMASLPEEIWLCNVTKTVCGGHHPMHIAITKIEPNNEKPYSWVKEKKVA